MDRPQRTLAPATHNQRCLSSLPIIGRRSLASSSFVLARALTGAKRCRRSLTRLDLEPGYLPSAMTPMPSVLSVGRMY